MRYYEKSQIQISEDSLTTPKNLRFEEDLTETDTASLTKSKSLVQEDFVVGTTAVSFGSITTAKFIFIKPISGPISVSINGGTAIVFPMGKTSKLWVTATSLSVTVLAGSGITKQTATIVIAG